ncbi:MAG TPA: AAA family ATPase [Longimicrobiaceae bacterium]|jgi:protein phosphatase|nr:AAA family ATPase [Longimicrobiaceae bacterium]
MEAALLRIPRNALVLLVGPSGCGKSTFARLHFRETEIVSSDECRRLVSNDPANQVASRAAFEVFRAIVRGRLSLSRLAVADATNLSGRSRRDLLAIAHEFGRPTVAIVFDLPLETCIRRAASRVRTVPADVVERQHWQLQHALPNLRSEGYRHVYMVRQRGAE